MARATSSNNRSVPPIGVPRRGSEGRPPSASMPPEFRGGSRGGRFIPEFLLVLGAVLPSNLKQDAVFDIMVPGKGITLVDALQETCGDGASWAAFQNLSPPHRRVGWAGRCAASETAPISSDSASARTNSSSDGSISSERSRTSPTSVIACQILSRRQSFCSLSIGMIITPFRASVVPSISHPIHSYIFGASARVSQKDVK